MIGVFVAGASIAAAYGLAVAPTRSHEPSSATSSQGLGRIAGDDRRPQRPRCASRLRADPRTCPRRDLQAFAGDPGSGAFRVRALRHGESPHRLPRAPRGARRRPRRGGALRRSPAPISRRRRRAFDGWPSVAFYYTNIAPTKPATASRQPTGRVGAGELDIWKIATRMIEDKPIVGVGSGSFQVASIHYLLVEPGVIESDTYIVDQPAVAHNTYLPFRCRRSWGWSAWCSSSPSTGGSVAACAGPLAARTFGRDDFQWRFSPAQSPLPCSRSLPPTCSSPRSSTSTCGSCYRWGPRCSPSLRHM